MKILKIGLGLIALAPLFVPLVVGAAGAAPVPPGATAQQGSPNGPADNEALKQCIGKVKADRAKLMQDRQSLEQLRQNHSSGQADQQQLQSLKEQFHQDMKTMKEDKRICIQLYQDLHPNGKPLPHNPSGDSGPDGEDETP